MLLKSLLTATALAFAAPAFAHESVHIVDPYARSSGMMAQAGAAFFTIENHASTDDRLIKAASDVAERVELHTHKADANGNMQMVEVPEGFAIPAGGSYTLQRGGDHVMFLGLKEPLEQGKVIKVTLTFEKAGDVVVEVPVDLERKPDHAMQGHMHGGQMQDGHMHGHMHGQKAPSN